LLKQVYWVFSKGTNSSNYEKVCQIPRAHVPLVKLREKESQIEFDISFNCDHSINQIKETRAVLENYPELKPLFFVLKLMLKQKGLNRPAEGGVGSFLLFSLVHAYLVINRTNYYDSSLKDLSELLLDFFSFYCNSFNYDKQCVLIRATAQGGPMLMERRREEENEADSSVLLAVFCEYQNPQRNFAAAAARKFPSVLSWWQSCLSFLRNNHQKKEGESFVKYLVDPTQDPRDRKKK